MTFIFYFGNEFFQKKVKNFFFLNSASSLIIGLSVGSNFIMEKKSQLFSRPNQFFLILFETYKDNFPLFLSSSTIPTK